MNVFRNLLQVSLECNKVLRLCLLVGVDHEHIRSPCVSLDTVIPVNLAVRQQRRHCQIWIGLLNDSVPYYNSCVEHLE